MSPVTPFSPPGYPRPHALTQPARTLADWTPEAGDVTEWLARWKPAPR